MRPARLDGANRSPRCCVRFRATAGTSASRGVARRGAAWRSGSREAVRTEEAHSAADGFRNIPNSNENYLFHHQQASAILSIHHTPQVPPFPLSPAPPIPLRLLHACFTPPSHSLHALPGSAPRHPPSPPSSSTLANPLTPTPVPLCKAAPCGQHSVMFGGADAFV
jgi:hypothetical protein